MWWVQGDRPVAEKENPAMRRKSFDIVASAAGLVIAVVMLIASALLFWGHAFVDDNVRTQLADQRITMPAGQAIADPAIKPHLQKYAGQPMTNGAQAEAYANHFIKVHLKETTGDRTYAELSTASRLDPSNTELQGLVQTSFRGETLRGLLLNAYAFWKMGQIALYAAWTALGSGAVLVLLSVLGLLHARRTGFDAELHVPGWHPEKTASA
jgi:hypothetical protein